MTKEALNSRSNMTKADIIDMAKEAGLELIHGNFMTEAQEKFANLVSAAEREACAKVCDALAYHPEFASDVTKLAAMAIRARGQA